MGHINVERYRGLSFTVDTKQTGAENRRMLTQRLPGSKLAYWEGVAEFGSKKRRHKTPGQIKNLSAVDSGPSETHLLRFGLGFPLAAPLLP